MQYKTGSTIVLCLFMWVAILDKVILILHFIWKLLQAWKETHYILYRPTVYVSFLCYPCISVKFAVFKKCQIKCHYYLYIGMKSLQCNIYSYNIILCYERESLLSSKWPLIQRSTRPCIICTSVCRSIRNICTCCGENKCSCCRHI